MIRAIIRVVISGAIMTVSSSPPLSEGFRTRLRCFRYRAVSLCITALLTV